MNKAGFQTNKAFLFGTLAVVLEQDCLVLVVKCKRGVRLQHRASVAPFQLGVNRNHNVYEILCERNQLSIFWPLIDVFDGRHGFPKSALRDAVLVTTKGNGVLNRHLRRRSRDPVSYIRSQNWLRHPYLLTAKATALAPPFPAMSSTTARLREKIFGSENQIPVISSTDYIRGSVSKNPKSAVNISFIFRCAYLIKIIQVITYITNLFPILGWITRYSQYLLVASFPFDSLVSDRGWLAGDVIAGLTVGMVLVPQGMSYAQVRSPSDLMERPFDET